MAPDSQKTMNLLSPCFFWMSFSCLQDPVELSGALSRYCVLVFRLEDVQPLRPRVRADQAQVVQYPEVVLKKRGRCSGRHAS